MTSVSAFLLLAALAVQAPQQTVQQAPDSAGRDATVQLVPETEIDRVTRETASQLRCPVCQGLSIQDSPSPLAQEMRDLIHDKLAAGDSPEDVKAYFVGRYGEWVLLQPEAKGFNLTVYVLPVIAVLLGGAIVFVAAKRWMTASAGNEAPTAIDESDPDLAPWMESRK